MRWCWRGSHPLVVAGRLCSSSAPLTRASFALTAARWLHASRQTGQTESPTSSPNREKAAFDPQSEWSVKARHALRAILRECTYLPDAQTRAYLTQHALSRFKTYSFKAWKGRDKSGLEARLEDKHVEAQRALNQLRRANQGERKPLLKAMLMAYGRIGKRRRELLIPLLPKAGREEIERAMEERAQVEDLLVLENTEMTDDLSRFDAGPESRTQTIVYTEDAIASERTLEKQNGAQRYLPPDLHALVQSQMRANVPVFTRRNPRRLEPHIPSLDSKMRPLAAKRIKNITRRWYADLIDRVHPPLPVQEWHHLRHLASGTGIPSHFPQRRTSPTSSERASSRSASALEMVVTRRRGMADKRVFGNPEAHTITPRYMQRLYAQVFGQCPLMDWDSQSKKWNITWGSHSLYNRSLFASELEAAVTSLTAEDHTIAVRGRHYPG